MPARGEDNAPIFDRSRPQELPRFFEELEYLFQLANITNEAARKRHMLRYVDFDTEQLWKYLPSYSDASATYCDFKLEVLSFYPDVDLYSMSDMDALIAERQRLGFSSVNELGDFHLRFLAISDWLIKKEQLCDLEQHRTYIRAFPLSLLPSIMIRLQIRHPDHRPHVPYPISDVYAAAQFVLRSPPAAVPPHPLQYSAIPQSAPPSSPLPLSVTLDAHTSTLRSHLSDPTVAIVGAANQGIPRFAPSAPQPNATALNSQRSSAPPFMPIASTTQPTVTHSISPSVKVHTSFGNPSYPIYPTSIAHQSPVAARIHEIALCAPITIAQYQLVSLSPDLSAKIQENIAATSKLSPSISATFPDISARNSDLNPVSDFSLPLASNLVVTPCDSSAKSQENIAATSEHLPHSSAPLPDISACNSELDPISDSSQPLSTIPAITSRRSPDLSAKIQENIAAPSEPSPPIAVPLPDISAYDSDLALISDSSKPLDCAPIVTLRKSAATAQDQSLPKAHKIAPQLTDIDDISSPYSFYRSQQPALPCSHNPDVYYCPRPLVYQSTLISDKIGSDLKYIPKLSPEPPPYRAGIIHPLCDVLLKNAHSRRFSVVKGTTPHHLVVLHCTTFILGDSNRLHGLEGLISSATLPDVFRISQISQNSRNARSAPQTSQAPSPAALTIQKSTTFPLQVQNTRIIANRKYDKTTASWTLPSLLNILAIALVLTFISLSRNQLPFPAKPFTLLSAFALTCVFVIAHVSGQLLGLGKALYILCKAISLSRTYYHPFRADTVLSAVPARFYMLKVRYRYPRLSLLPSKALPTILTTKTVRTWFNALPYYTQSAISPHPRAPTSFKSSDHSLLVRLDILKPVFYLTRFISSFHHSALISKLFTSASLHYISATFPHHYSLTNIHILSRVPCSSPVNPHFHITPFQRHSFSAPIN